MKGEFKKNNNNSKIKLGLGFLNEEEIGDKVLLAGF